MNQSAAIEFDHFFGHSPAAVWQALTDAELHARWWAAGDVRPVVGHRFALDMGRWGPQACEVLQVEHERLFQFRFATGTLDTIITWRLTPERGGTRLTLTHERFDLDAPVSRQAFEGMKPGWPAVLARLESALNAATSSARRGVNVP
jgi:uncharacterized protein YndB with AHSA1/START domain